MHAYLISNKRPFNRERIIGYILALPFSWPSPPLYWCSFLVFIYVLMVNKSWSVFNPTSSRKTLSVYILIILALFSNLYNLNGPYPIDGLRIFSTSFIFILFLFGGLLRNRLDILYGFTQMMFLWAILVITLAIYKHIWEYGSLLFSVPNYRLWGASFFPDWPNYFAFFLALAFLLSAIVFDRPIVSSVIVIAGLLTTSRTILIALSLFVFYVLIKKICSGNHFKRLMYLSSVIIFLAIIITFVSKEGELFKGELFNRLMIFSDRLEIYSYALHMFKNSFFIGNGAVLMDDSIGFHGFSSFHNTYLDIVVRYGVLAFIPFLILIIPNYGDLKSGGLVFIAIILFFIFGSMFQNFLKHPHIIMLYSVIIYSRRLFRK